MKESDYVIMKHYDAYKSFIAECKNKTYENNIKLHKHHIIPKFMGGDNSKNNIVNLSEDDHALAHYLFSMCFEENSKEQIGNLRSSRLLNKYKLGEIDESKITRSYYGVNNPFYGRKHNQNTIDKLKQNTFENRTGISYEEFYGDNAQTQKDNRSVSVKKYWDSLTEEQKTNRKASLLNYVKTKPYTPSHNAIKITIDGITYPSLQKASVLLGISFYKLRKLYEIDKDD